MVYLDLKHLSADDDNDVNLNEIALQLKSLGDTTTEEELQEFNFIDDESSSKIYQADNFFGDTNDQEIQKNSQKDISDDDDEKTTAVSRPSHAVSSNGSLDKLLSSSMQLERELLSLDVQNEAGKEYEKCVNNVW